MFSAGGPASPNYKLIKFVPSAISVDLAARGASRWTPITLSRLIAEDSISWVLDGVEGGGLHRRAP